MNTICHVFSSLRTPRVAGSWLTAAILIFAATSIAGAQQNFQTPVEAANALVGALRMGPPEAILRVLGRGGRDIATSGDAVADEEIRKRFLAAYDEKNQIAMEGENKASLVIGKEDFPFPIPIVRRSGRWMFDTAAGRREILERRIGRNELDAIQVSLAYVDAQFEYAEEDRTGAGAGVYAQRFVSQPGKKDGLYWLTSPGEAPSPLGDLFAEASNEGYRISGRPQPFHGYFYKILTAQGPAATGGAIDYMVRRRMIGGFALVAYPSAYRNSGIMTFVVNHLGVVYEKDLGWQTGRIAWRMRLFNPDETWHKSSPTGLKEGRAIRFQMVSHDK